MRMGFEGELRSFGEAAKKEIKGERPDKESRLKKAAEKQHTGFGTQAEIYGIQKEKQRIMQQLKERLVCLDNPECRSERKPKERPAKFDEKTNTFLYEDDKGKNKSATFGEILTDMDWKVKYYMGKESVPRPMIKKYYVELAKKELNDLLDFQIIKSETGSSIVHWKKKEAYGAIEKERKSGLAEYRGGVVSEKIVKNFLKKLSIDKDLPFEIREGDVFQDVEQKIDFIIHLKDKFRGVNVEADKKIKDVGIQFTTALGLEDEKRQQIERAEKQMREEGEKISDIALVVFPLTVAGILKKEWEDKGRPAGGPDKFLYRHVAQELFKKLMRDIMPQKEIDNYWDRVRNNFPEKPKT